MTVVSPKTMDERSCKISSAFAFDSFLQRARATIALLPSSALALALLACGSEPEVGVCSEAGARMVACELSRPARYVCLTDSAFDQCWAACVADADCEDLKLTLCNGAETPVSECAASCSSLSGKCSEPKWSDQCRALSCSKPGEEQTCWWSRGPDGPASCGR